jgi:hypothetical protein
VFYHFWHEVVEFIEELLYFHHHHHRHKPRLCGVRIKWCKPHLHNFGKSEEKEER